MSVHRFNLARAAGGLALAMAVALAGGAARAQAGPKALDHLLRAQSDNAVLALYRDYRTGGMNRVRDRKDACWADLARMSPGLIGPVETKAAYCAAFAYAGYIVDAGMAKMLKMPPTPGFEQATVDREVRDGLTLAQCPPGGLEVLSRMIQSHTVKALNSHPY